VLSVANGPTAGTMGVAIMGTDLLGAPGESDIRVYFNPFGTAGVIDDVWVRWAERAVAGDASPPPTAVTEWLAAATPLPVVGAGVAVADVNSAAHPGQTLTVDIPPGCGEAREVIVTVDGIPAPPVLFSYDPPRVTNIAAVKSPRALGVLTLVLEGINFCTPPSPAVGGASARRAAALQGWARRAQAAPAAGSSSSSSSVIVVGGVAFVPTFSSYDMLMTVITEPSEPAGAYSLEVALGGPGVSAMVDATPVPGPAPSFANETLEWHGIDTRGGAALVIPDVLSLGTADPAKVNVTVAGAPCAVTGIVATPQGADIWHTITCTVPPGVGGPVPVVVSGPGGSSVSAAASLFYARPAVSAVVAAASGARLGTDGATGAGIPVTGTRVFLVGDYFGASPAAAAPAIVVSAGGGAAVPVIVLAFNHTHVTFDFPPGQGAGVVVSVVVGGQPAAPVLVRYAPPTVAAVTPQGVGTAGGVALSITGANFGVAPAGATAARGAPVVTVGGRPCPLASGWTPSPAADSITCILPAGHGAGVPVVVTVADQSSAPAPGAAYTYAPPTVTWVSRRSGPTAGGIAITVTGTNFGIAPVVSLVPPAGGAAAGVAPVAAPPVAAGAFNHTALTFILPEGVGAGLFVVVTAGGQSSPTGPAAAFSYDRPALSMDFARDGSTAAACAPRTQLVPRARDGVFVPRTTIGNCFPTAGGYRLAINGTSLGPASAPLALTVGGSPCTVVEHSHSRAVCVVPPGVGDALALVAAVGGQVSAAAGSGAPLFAYDPPVVTAVTPNVPDGAGGETLIIQGANFGGIPAPVNITIGGLACTGATWVNDSVLTCVSPRSAVGPKTVELTAAARAAPAVWGADEEVVVVMCKSGAYGLRGEMCIPCAEEEPGAACPGAELDTDRVTARPGFFRRDVLSSSSGAAACHPLRRGIREACPVFLPCEPPAACLGANVCAVGYSGDRCASCDDGFYRIGGKCRACPDRTSGLVAFFGVIAVLTVAAMYATAKRFLAWPILAIIIDYAQVLSLMGRVSIAWPQYVRMTLLAASASTFNLELVAPECSHPEATLVARWVSVQVLPFFAWGVLAVTWLVREVVGPAAAAAAKSAYASASGRPAPPARVRGRSAAARADPYIATGVSVFRFMFVYLARNSLDVFDCAPTTPSTDGRTFMGGDVSWPCYEGAHAKLVPAAAVSILVFLIALPGAAMFVLYRHRTAIFADMLAVARGRSLDELDRADRAGVAPATATFRARWHGLYHKFKPSRWAWEGVIALRKFGVVLVSLMFNRVPVFQQGLALLVLLAALGVHVRIRPYMSPERSAKLLQAYDPVIQRSTARELARIAETSGGSVSRLVGRGARGAPGAAAAAGGVGDDASAGIDDIALTPMERALAATNAKARRRVLNIKTLSSVAAWDVVLARGLLLQFPAIAWLVDPNAVETVLLSSLVIFNVLGFMLGSALFSGPAGDRFFTASYDQACAAAMAVLVATAMYIVACAAVDAGLRFAPDIVRAAAQRLCGCGIRSAFAPEALLARLTARAKANSAASAAAHRKQFKVADLVAAGAGAGRAPDATPDAFVVNPMLVTVRTDGSDAAADNRSPAGARAGVLSTGKASFDAQPAGGRAK
jgi:hypothetical protein